MGIMDCAGLGRLESLPWRNARGGEEASANKIRPRGGCGPEGGHGVSRGLPVGDLRAYERFSSCMVRA